MDDSDILASFKGGHGAKDFGEQPD